MIGHLKERKKERGEPSPRFKYLKSSTSQPEGKRRFHHALPHL